jgi:hypothetical protein
MNALTTAGVLVAGGLGNAFLTRTITSQAFVPEMLRTKPGYYLPGVLGAGLLGMATRAVAPRYAGTVTLGGLVQVLVKAVEDYLPQMPFLGAALGDFLTTSQVVRGATGMTGMRDFLTLPQAAGARRLSGLGGADIVAEALTDF